MVHQTKLFVCAKTTKKDHNRTIWRDFAKLIKFNETTITKRNKRKLFFESSAPSLERQTDFIHLKGC